jgi:hypothetical protein
MAGAEIDGVTHRIPIEIAAYIDDCHQLIYSLSTRISKYTPIQTDLPNQIKFVSFSGGTSSKSNGRVRKQRNEND